MRERREGGVDGKGGCERGKREWMGREGVGEGKRVRGSEHKGPLVSCFEISCAVYMYMYMSWEGTFLLSRATVFPSGAGSLWSESECHA